MHKALAWIAFGWLTFIGVGHFSIDVVSQYLRHKRAPSAETTLYYGLNSAYALGQVLLGALGLLLLWWSIDLLGRWPGALLVLVATAGWAAIAFSFMEYREPRVMLAVFALLALAAAVTR